MTIKAVIFDINGVVVVPKYEKIYEYLVLGSQKAKKNLMNVFEEKFRKKMPDTYHETRRLDVNVLGIIKSLKATSITTAALTNTSTEFGDYFRQIGLDDFFDPLMLSGDLGSRKPNKRIYELALQMLKLKPEQCIFIDDKRSNIEPAERLGMKVILYRNSKQLKADLIRHGVKIE